MSLKYPLHIFDGRFICDADNTPVADGRKANDPGLQEIVALANQAASLREALVKADAVLNGRKLVMPDEVKKAAEAVKAALDQVSAP